MTPLLFNPRHLVFLVNSYSLIVSCLVVDPYISDVNVYVPFMEDALTMAKLFVELSAEKRYDVVCPHWKSIT